MEELSVEQQKLSVEQQKQQLQQKKYELEEKIRSLKVNEETKKKKDSFWNKKFNKRKFEKPGRVAVIYLRSNGTADTMIVESKKGFFNIEGRTYHEDGDCIYSISKERIPLAIIPDWSLIPFGTKEWHDKSMLEKFANCQDHVIRGIRHAELVRMGDKEPMNIDLKKMIGIGIIMLVIGVVIANYI